MKYCRSWWYLHLIPYFVEGANFENWESFFENSQNPFNMVSQDNMPMIEQLLVVLWTMVAMPKLFQVVLHTSVRCKKELGISIPTINQVKLPLRYFDTSYDSRTKYPSIVGRPLPAT